MSSSCIAAGPLTHQAPNLPSGQAYVDCPAMQRWVVSSEPRSPSAPRVSRSRREDLAMPADGAAKRGVLGSDLDIWTIDQSLPIGH